MDMLKYSIKNKIRNIKKILNYDVIDIIFHIL